MANVFDQFDQNTFDQFDVAPRQETFEEGLAKTPGRMVRSTIQGVAAIPNIIADPFYRLAGLTPPAQGLRQSLTAFGLPEYPQDPLGRIAEASTEALAGTGAQIATVGRLGQQAISDLGRRVAERFTAQPTAQMVAAPVAAGTGEETFRRTQDPLVSTLASMAAGGATGIRRQPETTFAKQLRKEADQAYKLAERAGLVVQPGYVKNISDQVSKRAFDEGYDPGLHPQVAAVLKRLADEGNTPKTLQELDRLRRIVRAPGKTFDNPDQQRIAAQMIDEFDTLVQNIGTTNVNVTGNKTEALSALNKARDAYNKSRKVSIIEDMVENATTRASQQTQGGLDNTLRNQFVNLETNKKRMASFTQAEQDEITRIARGGGNVQQMLRFVGRFAIRGPVSGIFAGGASAVEPFVGIPLTIAAEGSKRGAEALRQRDVSRLMEQIAQQQMTRQPSIIPITAMRGLLSTQME